MALKKSLQKQRLAKRGETGGKGGRAMPVGLTSLGMEARRRGMTIEELLKERKAKRKPKP